MLKNGKIGPYGNPYSKRKLKKKAKLRKQRLSLRAEDLPRAYRPFQNGNARPSSDAPRACVGGYCTGQPPVQSSVVLLCKRIEDESDEPYSEGAASLGQA